MKKLTNKKGFTLMEMLIVVAIIVILVVIAFPMFSSQLDKARAATDDANLRSAEAVAAADYMLDEGLVESGYYYDLETGKFDSTVPDAYGESSAHEGMVIQVTIDADAEDEIKVEWVTATTGGGT